MITRRLLLASGAAFAGVASAEPPKVLAEGDPVIADGRQYRVRAGNGQEYLVRVAAPQKQPPAGQKPGALYVLDGNWYFGVATDIARMLPIGTTTPPVFVIGVGYPVTAFDDVVTNRERDYTYLPFTDRPEVGGGGAAFERFLVEDLRAFIGERHAVDHSRAFIAGQSLGGIFTANLLVKRPDAFAGYLIGSPSLWQDATTLSAAERFAAGGGRRVMIGVGADESPGMRKGAADLAAALQRPESGLDVAARIFERQHHMSMQGAWFAEGMRYLLDAKPAARL